MKKVLNVFSVVYTMLGLTLFLFYFILYEMKDVSFIFIVFALAYTLLGVSYLVISMAKGEKYESWYRRK